MRSLLVIASTVVLVGGLVLATRSGSDGTEGDEIALGHVYSTDAGDPVDVVAEPGDMPGTICANVGGSFYGSGSTCFARDGTEVTGSWVLAIPAGGRRPRLVVGVLPASASGATVTVADERFEATSRGRWFIASLEPGVLGQSNAETVQVGFD
jgi:hypothetical protein